MAIYQAYVPGDNASAANFMKWGTAFGQAMLNFGWVAQTGHGELVATNVSGVWTWTTTPNAPTAAATISKVVPNFRGAWSSGATYLCSSTTSNASVCDVVTNGGLTYIHITASSSSATAPGSDSTNWQPWQFEIFKSNDSLSSTLPIYVKFVYTNQNASCPKILIQVGTGVDSNGNLTGCIIMDSSTAPTNTGFWLGFSAANTNSVFEMDFSGDAGNFRMAAWRNGVQQGQSGSSFGPMILVIDRAKTAAGADTDAYVWAGLLTSTGSGGVQSSSAILLKSSLGALASSSTSTASGAWVGSLQGMNSASLGNFGSSPAMPIFPMLGYLANPLLGAVTVQKQDYQNGSIIPVWIYGAVHTYLCCGNDCTIAAFATSCSNGPVPAIRWE